MKMNQVSKLALKIARKYKDAEQVRRGDIIRDVVRSNKLNMEESLICADCIVKGMYQAGKTVVVA
jgi:hypothetical protein